jgi:hypothetical protein
VLAVPGIGAAVEGGAPGVPGIELPGVAEGDPGVLPGLGDMPGDALGLLRACAC